MIIKKQMTAPQILSAQLELLIKSYGLMKALAESGEHSAAIMKAAKLHSRQVAKDMGLAS